MLHPQQSIFGGRYDAKGYNNGGSWLNSVFRQSDITASIKKNKNKNKKQMHKKKKNKHKKNKAGYTWQAQGPIITSSEPKPTIPAWGGAGDGVVIWHEVGQRWILRIILLTWQCPRTPPVLQAVSDAAVFAWTFSSPFTVKKQSHKVSSYSSVVQAL